MPELKRRRIDEGKLGRPANAHGWEEKLAESKKRGYQCLDEFWQYYQLDRTTCDEGIQESPCISLKSFNTCMAFIECLTSRENIERVIGLIRAERLGSRTEIPESTLDKDLTG
jgi:hypothetical protein